mgnify:FL=1
MSAVKIKKEDLIKGSIKIIRDEGDNNLSARNLAKVVGCSTQPIFRLFTNMDELKRTVYDDVYELQKKYLLKGNEHQVPFIGVGLSYIDFATKEKNLFKFLFMSSFTKYNNILEMADNEDGKKYTEMIIKSTGLSPESSKQIYINTWLIIHGIASMMATTNSKLTKDDIETIIFDAFKGYRQVLMNKELNTKYKKAS